MKSEVAKVCFTITGEYMTNQARDFWREHRYGYALHFIMDSLVGIDLNLSIQILEGKKKFTGDSNIGIGVESDDFKYDESDLVSDSIENGFQDLYQKARKEALTGMNLVLYLANEVKYMKFDPTGCSKYNENYSYLTGTIEYYENRYTEKYKEQQLLMLYGVISPLNEYVLHPWFSREFNDRVYQDMLYRSFDDDEYNEYSGRIKTQSAIDKDRLEEFQEKTFDQRVKLLNEEYAATHGVVKDKEDDSEQDEDSGFLTKYGDWFAELQNKSRLNRSEEKECIKTLNCYIAPDGKIIDVGFEGHIGASEEIAKSYKIDPHKNNCLGFNFNDYQEALNQAGFIQISKRRIFPWAARKPLTQSQRDALFDWFYENGERCCVDMDKGKVITNYPELIEYIEKNIEETY